jgi:ATP-binding cassette subfamily B protein
MKYKKRVVISTFAIIMQVAAGFMIPYLMTDIIDVALPDENGVLLMQLSGLMLLAALLGLAGGLINNYQAQFIAMNASADLRLDLFKKIQSLSFNNLDKFKTSRLITSSTNDVVRVQTFYQMLFRIIISAPLMVGVGLFMALITSRGLSQIFYITIPLLIIVIVVIMIVAMPKFKRVQKSVDNLNKVSLENVNAPRVIKSFVNTKIENEKFEEANERFRFVNTSAEKVMAFAEPLIMFIFNASLGGLVYLGSILVQDGKLIEMVGGIETPALGVLIAFSSYSMQILFGLMMLAMMLIFIARAEVSAKRITEIFDDSPDILNGTNPIFSEIDGTITFDKVCFGYGSNLVLRNLSFTVNQGETVGIIGSTGSGKSSMINLIPRLYDVSEGAVLIDGIDVREYDMHTLRQSSSVVTQKATIFSGSIGTNIVQGKNDADFNDVVSAAKQADAYEFIKDYDDMFNHETQQKGSNLSGGQKQRLSLTRAFIRKPKILILDDSTSAVDAKSEEYILSSIKELSNQMTTLVISQKISTVKNMDKIIVLNNKGELDGYGTHAALLKESSVYKEIALSQLGNGGGVHE